jgi:glycosyltransferase involved in cell wall biosynthesis
VAGRGEAPSPDIAFIPIALLDSQAESVLKLKSDLDVGRVPVDFEATSGRIMAALERAVGDADWLIAHNVCSLHKNLALAAALFKMAQSRERPRLVLWHHDLAWTAQRYRRELHPGYPWDLLRTDWPQAVQVTISRHRQNELAELLHVEPDRIRVIPNALDPMTFLQIGETTRALVSKYELTEADPLILFPARITRRKNTELALSIVAELWKGMPRVRIVITGPVGPHNPANVAYLKSLLKLREELNLDAAATFLAESTPAAPDDRTMAELYRLSDLVLITSSEEGFGIPILEAGLAGIPVFCSNIEPLREVGGNDVSYFSLEEEPKRVAQMIASELQHSKRYALKRRVTGRYNWDRVYTSYLRPLIEGV